MGTMTSQERTCFVGFLLMGPRRTAKFALFCAD